MAEHTHTNGKATSGEDTPAENHVTLENLIEMTPLEHSVDRVEDQLDEKPPLETALETEDADVRTMSEVDGRRRPRQSTLSYDFHKGIVASAMDISLLTANANQLRLLLTYNEQSRTYKGCIILVITSLVLQILVAVCVIIVTSYPKTKANYWIRRLKVFSSILVAIITVINILVASLVSTT